MTSRRRSIAQGFGVGPILAVLIAWSLVGCSFNSDGNPTLPVEQEPTPTRSDAGAVPVVGNGVGEDTVLFGQSAAFSGPAQELGLNMRLGIQAAFNEINQSGGVHGRELKLEFRDDSYEPEAAIANTRNLIEQEGVFALIGAVGTPTSRSAAPVAAELGAPYIAPFTGAEFLRDAEQDNIINLRASYYQETEEMVARLTEDLAVQRIAIIYQDDSFGLAGYHGVIGALERRNLEPVSIGVYTRNTTAVKTALLDVRLGSPEAIILVGAYRPVGELIAWARYTGLNPVFMTVSFVGSNALAEHLGPDGAGVIVTQVVPFPTGDSFPVAETYRRALSDYAPDAEPGFVSFEGYLAGRLAIFGLQICGRAVDRDCFLNGLRNAGDFDIDGFQLGYSDRDNQGSDTVFLTVIGQDGSYRPIDSLRDYQP